MLPTAPLPNTRLTVDDFPLPVRSTTQVLDALSEFVPGQKLIAQIQHQLANGAYRATIAQRDVTLALPFSAKPGDSLELDVVETDGRIAFAVSKALVGKEGEAAPASSSTTLSRTGQLIGQLLHDSDQEQQRPAQLNGGEPVLKAPPTSAKDAAPALQQAINRSGLFYESHQAAWVNGKLSEALLRQEPQAQLARAGLQNFPGNATLSAVPQPGATTGAAANATLAGQHPALLLAGTDPANPGANVNGATAGLNKSPLNPAEQPSGAERAKTMAALHATEANPTSSSARASQALSPDLAPLVQQQLASLANNVYPFQGAIWPGQQILWEIIDEDGGQGAPDPDEAPRQWKTRLKLLLPSLGDIDATIQLDGNDIVVQMKTSEANTQTKLKGDIEGLRSRLDLAGLRLMALDVKGYDGNERPG